MTSVALQIAVALAAGATLVVLVAAIPVNTRDLGSLLSDDQRTRRSRPLMILEALIVVVAIGSLVLLRRRGIVSDEASEGGVDLLLAASPVLLALAAAIVTMRLYRYPVRFLAWVGGQRKDLVTFVGFKRILQQPPVARLPLVVILIAVAVAVFSSVIRSSIDDGQEVTAWQEVGADYRIEGSTDIAQLTPTLDVESIEAVETFAYGHRSAFVGAVVSTSTQPAHVELLAVEMSRLDEVNRGNRAFVETSEAMRSNQISDEIGTEFDPLPAIFSTTWAAQHDFAIGDLVVLDTGRAKTVAVIDDLRERFPGMPSSEPFVVVDLATYTATQPFELGPTVAYLRAPAGAFDEIAAAVEDQTVAARLSSSDELVDEIRSAPFIGGASTALNLALILGLVFAAVAAVSALALTSKARSRDLGYLRTMGLSDGQASRLTIIEQVPQVVIAATVGTLLGIGIALVFDAGIALTAFTGSAFSGGLHFDWIAIVLVPAVLTLVASIAIAVYALINQNQDLPGLLKSGEER